MTYYENKVKTANISVLTEFVFAALLAFITCLLFSTYSGETSFLQWIVAMSFWIAFYKWVITKIKSHPHKVPNEADHELLYRDTYTAMENHYFNYPVFSLEKPFHELYELEGKSLEEFEKAMAAGMWYCGREVYVSAFVKDDIIIRVSTSVGDLTSCGPEEDICEWISLCKSLGCDYIREYHNHPCFDGHTGPSEADKSFHKKTESILNPKRIDIDSFIIYWNEVAEWKLMQYDASGNAATVKCFDANEQQIITLSKPKRSVSAMIEHYYFEYEKVSNRRK